jgi:spore coat protein JC
MIAAEQKSRATYENLIHLTDEHEIKEILKFLREREVEHKSMVLYHIL